MKTTIILEIEFDRLDIDSDYHQKEKQTLEHEGCEAGYEINKVEYNGLDLGELLLPLDYYNINQWLLNQNKNI